MLCTSYIDQHGTPIHVASRATAQRAHVLRQHCRLPCRSTLIHPVFFVGFVLLNLFVQHFIDFCLSFLSFSFWLLVCMSLNDLPRLTTPVISSNVFLYQDENVGITLTDLSPTFSDTRKSACIFCRPFLLSWCHCDASTLL